MRGAEYGVRHLVVDAPARLLDFVTSLEDVRDVDHARELIWLGAIYVNDARIMTDAFKLETQDRVRAHLAPRRYQKPKKLRIVHLDTGYLIADKPAGLPVHALVDNYRENLISFLEADRSEKLYITHRLDVDTTGLVVIARNSSSQAILNESFKSGRMKRRYKAFTTHALTPGIHVHFMKQSPKAPKEVSRTETPGSLRCELRVTSSKLIESTDTGFVSNGGYNDLSRAWEFKTQDPEQPRQVFENEIELITGRTHQIRAQLAALGAPIIGDRAYGSTHKLQDPDTSLSAIALWAFQIQNT